jgi:hypothetical protein
MLTSSMTSAIRRARTVRFAGLLELRVTGLISADIYSPDDQFMLTIQRSASSIHTSTKTETCAIGLRTNYARFSTRQFRERRDQLMTDGTRLVWRLRSRNRRYAAITSVFTSRNPDQKRVMCTNCELLQSKMHLGQSDRYMNAPSY